MDSIVKADIFFFIASIAVVILSILLIVAIYYLRETLANFRDISRTLKKGVDHATHHAERVVAGIDAAMIINKIFGKKKNGKRKGKDE